MRATGTRNNLFLPVCNIIRFIISVRLRILILQVKKPSGLRYSADGDGDIRVKSGKCATEVSKELLTSQQFYRERTSYRYYEESIEDLTLELWT